MLLFTGHTDAYGEYGTRRVQNVTAVSMLHLTLTDMDPSPGQIAGEITHKLQYARVITNPAISPLVITAIMP